VGKNVEQKPVAVVTGASSGVGKDIASILSSKDLAQVVYDILYYPGNLVVEEMAVQAIDPD